jgi:hypothetical protein
MKIMTLAAVVTFCSVLTGCGGDGSSVSSTPALVTPNAVPVAEAGTDQFMLLGKITLNGTFSKDLDSDRLTYKWSMISKPLGSVAALSDQTAVSPTFIADIAGNYVVTLIVNDGKIDSAQSAVTVNAAVESTWSVSSTVDALTKDPIQTLSLGGLSIICFGTSNTIVFGTGTNITSSGYIGYKVGSDPVVYETWNESPSSGYTLLRAGGFNMTMVQKLYQNVEFTFQYSAYLKGLQSSTVQSKNMYTAIEKTRAVCKWPTDIFPVHN